MLSLQWYRICLSHNIKFLKCLVLKNTLFEVFWGHRVVSSLVGSVFSQTSAANIWSRLGEHEQVICSTVNRIKVSSVVVASSRLQRIVSRVGGSSTGPRTHAAKKTEKETGHMQSSHLEMWSVSLALKCFLIASWGHFHLYLQLSTCDRITQDRC